MESKIYRPLTPNRQKPSGSRRLGRNGRSRYHPRMPAPKKAKTNETREKLSLYLPPSLANKLRHTAVDKRLKITALLQKYVEEGLERDGK